MELKSCIVSMIKLLNGTVRKYGLSDNLLYFRTPSCNHTPKELKLCNHPPTLIALSCPFRRPVMKKPVCHQNWSGQSNFGSQNCFPLANFSPPYETINSNQSKVAS